MIRNYLLIAWRNLRRSPAFSLLNGMGLAVGMAAFLLIYQYVRYERSYDRFYPDAAQLYRINAETFTNQQRDRKTVRTPPALLQREYSEIEAFTRVAIFGDAIVNRPVTPTTATEVVPSTRVEEIYATDPGFWSVFAYPVLAGDPAEGLQAPMTVVISARVARALFGKENPLNQSIQLNSSNIDGSAQFTVKGVYADVPVNAHLRPDILMSYVTIHQFMSPEVDDNWDWDNLFTYVRLRPTANPATLETQLAAWTEEQIGARLRENQRAVHYTLQPVTTIHLQPGWGDEPNPTLSGQTLYVLMGIGLLILLMAGINYVNLSTARAVRRAREVGVRKTAGASRLQLVAQFLTESFLLNVISAGLALTLFQLLQPYFGQTLTEMPPAFALTHWPPFWFLLAMLIVVGSLGAGLYPAFVLSGFRPAVVLKGTLGSAATAQRQGLRQGLVVFQFAASVLLIIATLTAARQLRFMQQRDLGLDLSQQLVVQAPAYLSGQGQFKQALAPEPDIAGIALSGDVPGREIYWRTDQYHRPGQDAPGSVTFLMIDGDFVEVYQLELLAGRTFLPTDTLQRPYPAMLNASAVTLFGFASPEAAVGQTLETGDQHPIIVGVLNDYHHQSPAQPIPPTLYRPGGGDFGNFYTIHTQTRNMPRTLAKVESTFKQLYPDSPFEYFFLDAFYAQQYRADERTYTLFGSFAGLAMLIGCLGLFGLSAYTAQQRTKEIGIRKVLGASVSSLLGLLSKDYLRLVVVANLVAIPLGWYLARQWLDQYAFRTELSGWLFLAPLLALLLIAGLTVSVQTLRAALANPVEALRSE
ncbi:putative ABC transport system permease protein [Catalinimonas alkaloidigena]|uniref:Putative ABC transport system permease protein n=1 Tax=Catalinimonas alkaloidigena TaxID=1075417 RepID=A0A1G9FC84_9BACT|nr:ABC transporter permease [Catalinimonas alkaloidigena]SDK85950.1 putative ABC transport system permease protein [Catalinimonas alkaloidigena]